MESELGRPLDLCDGVGERQQRNARGANKTRRDLLELYRPVIDDLAASP